MMSATVPLLVFWMMVGALGAPSASYENYPVVTEKRAALVLDRLLIALRQALQDGRENEVKNYRLALEEPRADPLQYRPITEINDMTAPQRRGQANNNRGRVLRCYFNAVTCF